MADTQAGWPQGWPWEWRETLAAGQTPKMWSIDLWKYGKFPSYVRPDWSPYTYNGSFFLIIKKIQDNFAEASIISWDWSMINFKIL